MMSSKQHITEQRWSVLREADPDATGMKRTTVAIAGEDGTTIAILDRSDEGSDLLIAGYIVALQNTRRDARPTQPNETPRDPRDHDERCVPTRMYSVWHCHPDCTIGRSNTERTS